MLALALAVNLVTVDGTRFLDGDQPFRFVGANVEVMHGDRNRARAAETLDAARADGLRVVRVWALGEGAADASEWSRANELFRAGPDGWIDAAYAQLDRVLALAKERGLRVILTVGNHWGDYGGVPQYLRWAGLPEHGWGARDRFFSDEKTRALYRAHLERLVDRYKHDATVFAWELLNESQVQTADGARARRQFIAEMARVIRERGARQLITPGVIGYASLKERDEWLAVCRLREVDYCDSHLYPQTSDAVEDPAQLDAFIDDRVQLAHFVAGKPVVFGEFGFDTRPERDAWLGRPRAGWFDAFLKRVRLDRGDGALAWIYQPWSGKPRDFGIYVDRADTDDVRGALKQIAALVDAPSSDANPLLSAERGTQPLYSPYRELRRKDTPHLTRSESQLTIALHPERFARARFERVGSWAGGKRVHAFGTGDGFFEWRFVAPERGRARLHARLSSEFPGEEAPPDGGSQVRVLIDGTPLATLDVIPDDGDGATHSLALGTLAAGTHTLRFEVPAGDRANGLCVYKPLTITFPR
jgi:mannan endo-1,4-beta-mannosidase